MNVKRGDVVAWWQEPHKPLKVMSDPYSFNGKETVTVQRVCKKKADRQQMLVLTSALVPYREEVNE